MGTARASLFAESDDPTDDLFLNLAEQVKMPFVQIAYAAELLTGADSNAAENERLRRVITLSSQNALHLIDGYLLSVELQRRGQLELEPVSMSSVLYDSAQNLQAYANEHGCELRLQIGGKYQPVMAHRPALRSALLALGYSFIDAADMHDPEKKSIVSMIVRRNPGGISAGVYADNPHLNAELLERARGLKGLVHQPMKNFDNGNAGGVFIADALFSSMHSTMKASRTFGLYGLAANFSPSRQLSLV